MSDRLVPGDSAGAETLAIMSAAPNFNNWMYQVIAPYLGRRVLEVGSGIGNMSAQMLEAGAQHLVLTDMDEWYRTRLRERFDGHASVRVDSLMLPDPTAANRFAADRLDTIVALNVVEHIQDDIGALATMRSMLAPGGRIVILVPAIQAIYGEMDRELGHCRRYGKQSLGAAFHEAGLRVDRMFWWNRVGVAGWWLNGRVRKVSRIPISQLKRFDSLVPLLKLERFLPLPFGQSLIAVGTPA
jgi:SAM-dependent methyltransferase